MLSDEAIVMVTAAAFGIAAVAAFSAVILYLRQLEKCSRRSEPAVWSCTAFNVGAVAPRLRRVRRDYLCVMHSRHSPAFHSRGLVAAARRSVHGKLYFHDQRARQGMSDAAIDEQGGK